MLVWQEKEELLAPEVFHALTTALRREPRLRFTLTEVNDLTCPANADVYAAA